MTQKWKVAFLCRENSCRSQIAEALAKRIASDLLEVYSAGIRPIDRIDPGAVRVLKQTHGIDMLAEGQLPKTVEKLPEIDILIYMGCKVECTKHSCQVSLGWNISDPKGGTDDAYRKAIHDIEQNILTLRKDIITGKINRWKKEEINHTLPTVFPFWDDMTPAQQNQILTGWRTEIFQKKQQIFETSDDCKGIMIVQTGCLRFYMLSEQGKEVSLFRLFPGDVCVLSAACMVEELDFDIIIETTEYTEVATIPAGDVELIMSENLFFSLFLYKKIAERFSDVMSTIQHVFLKKIDQRIAQYLLDEMNRTHTTAIRTTHDHIAREIFSAREVVSKTLRRISEDGIIEIKHEKINILDVDKLRSLI